MHRSRSDISWVGSIAVFFLFFTGIISGRLTDAGYFRITTIAGAFLVVLGTFTTSLSHEYWQILLAQGLCTGLGNGFLLTPMMTLLTTYFRRRLAFVMGIAACGSTTGGLIYPSMARTLLPTIGFGWTMRAIGFIQLGTFAIALVCAVPKRAPKRSSPVVDFSVFRAPEFTFYLIGAFLVSLLYQSLPIVLSRNVSYKPLGLPRCLLPVLFPQFLRTGETAPIIYRFFESHARSKWYRFYSPTTSELDRQVSRYDECFYSIPILICSMHVHLDPSSFDPWTLRLDHIL